jgi:hypothetical protein
MATMHSDTRDGRYDTAGVHGTSQATDHRFDRPERSIVDLFKELRDETTLLVREEVTLAKTEMSEKVNRVARNTGYLAGGSLVAFAGAIVLLMAAAAGLYAGLVAMDVSHYVAGWLAPLIVGAVALAIGYAFLQKAITTLKNESVVPERTAKTIQDDTNWMKQKVSR